ncbi:diphthamide synthesis protein [Candidatus Woesearchaeota archaeon]|nr:diphthamide synthesis protein [Candidatus Woesearchaeota archaeon]
MKYNLELDRVVKDIKQQKAKMVCIQLPDGLKPEANKITDRIKKDTSAEVVIWLGSCFGACDVPLEVSRIGADMIIQWGHSAWKP